MRFTITQMGLTYYLEYVILLPESTVSGNVISSSLVVALELVAALGKVISMNDYQKIYNLIHTTR